MAPDREPLALEIHDLDERQVLAFDLTEVIEALSAASAHLDWLGTDFDPVTLGDERPGDADVWRFATEVEEARPDPTRRGVRITAAQLRDIGQKTLQTIDGEFIGVDPAEPPGAPPPE